MVIVDRLGYINSGLVSLNPTTCTNDLDKKNLKDSSIKGIGIFLEIRTKKDFTFFNTT